MFADACVADAEYAVPFNKNVASLMTNATKDIENLIKNDLKKWSEIQEHFLKTDKNPNTKPLESLSKNLSSCSKLLLNALSTKKITQIDLDKLEFLLTRLEAPFLDTELAIVSALNQLSTYCEITFLVK